MADQNLPITAKKPSLVDKVTSLFKGETDDVDLLVEKVKDPAWWNGVTRPRVQYLHDVVLGSQGSLRARHKLLVALDKGCKEHFGVKTTDYIAGYSPELAAQVKAGYQAEQDARLQKLDQVVANVQSKEWWDKASPKQIRQAYENILDSSMTLYQMYSPLKRIKKECNRRYGCTPLDL